MAETELLQFRTLYDSPMIVVRDYVCQHDHREASPEEESDSNSVTLMRNGAFARHFGKRKVTSDVNQVSFFAKGTVYRVSHPSGCGDRGTSMVVAESILNDIIREVDPAIDDRDDPFPFASGPCDTQIFLRHRDYVRRLETAGIDPLEPLWADVTGLQLIADVLEAAYLHAGAKPRKRASTIRDHADRAEAAKEYIARHLGENITLADVAAVANASPFNFARLFQQQTGMPVHRYLTRLRLRTSLERISEPDADLTTIALDLGFSSHSHFTDVFRREFDKTPSEVRQTATLAGLNEMSKDLIV
ncbi:MAG TPA: AraC family transcriptional regulator [Pyrinomonadaceae bacterium]